MSKHRDRIISLLLEGRSYREIIAATGAAKGTISFHAKRLGNPNRRQLSEKAMRAKEMISLGKKNPEIRLVTGLSLTRICELRKELNISGISSWSSDDWKEFQNLYDSGLSIRACCSAFQITMGSVSYAKQRGLFVGRPKKCIPIELVTVENGTYARGNLKKRLIESGLLRNECIECGVGPFWNSKPLTLSLDHINGVNNDNRLENLRLLCPNCHSQTATFAGRNVKKAA